MPRPPGFSVVDFGIPTASLEAYATALSLPDAAAAARSLAEELTRDSLWAELPPGSLCVRTDGSPQIVAIGAFDSPARRRLEVRVDALHSALRHLTYVDPVSVHAAVQALAEALRARFGDPLLRTCRFVGLPRGGLIVLGWLAYALELEQSQMGLPEAGGEIVVVVDDCAISGARFGEWLRGHPDHRVILATLYAPPATREAIEARESQVLGCVSARDLGDYGEAELGSGLESWQQEWAGRLKGPRYWIGRTDHLCFPWKEPDRSVFDPITQRVEPAWALTSPPFADRSRPAVPLIRIPATPEALCPAEGVVYGEVGEQTVVSHLPSGQSVGLSGTAAELWEVLLHSRSPEAALRELQRRYPEARDELAADFGRFVGDLERLGFLREEC